MGLAIKQPQENSSATNTGQVKIKVANLIYIQGSTYYAGT